MTPTIGSAILIGLNMSAGTVETLRPKETLGKKYIAAPILAGAGRLGELKDIALSQLIERLASVNPVTRERALRAQIEILTQKNFAISRSLDTANATIKKLTQENDTARSDLNKMEARRRHAAHDLRSPMTSILGYAQLMTRNIRKGAEAPPEGILNSLGIIEKQVNRATGIIDDLLEQDSSNKTVSVAAIFNNYLVDMAPILGKQGVTVKIPQVSEDAQVPAEIGKAIYALANNGAKAMENNPEEEERVLTLSQVVFNNNLFISITDNGTGMSKEVLEKVGKDGEDRFSTNSGAHGFGVEQAIAKVISVNGSILYTNKGITMNMMTRQLTSEDPTQAEKRGTVVTIIVPLNTNQSVDNPLQISPVN